MLKDMIYVVERLETRERVYLRVHLDRETTNTLCNQWIDLDSGERFLSQTHEIIWSWSVLTSC